MELGDHAIMPWLPLPMRAPLSGALTASTLGLT